MSFGRLCFMMELVPGTEADYDRAHAKIWPELADAILDVGYRNYSLFRRGSQVICYCECVPDVATVRARMEARHADLVARWNEEMRPFIRRDTAAGDDVIEYPLCWHLDDRSVT